jgi:hypothetical protein
MSLDGLKVAKKKKKKKDVEIKIQTKKRSNLAK